MAGVVLVTSRSFSSGKADVERQLTDAGYQVIRADVHHRREELAPLLIDAVAWIAGTAPVTDDLLGLAPKLRIVARYGVGFDAVDLGAAARRNIVVTNTPGANSASVADLALALLLTSLRTIPSGNRAVRSGNWSAIRGREVSSLTVGVAGFGRIGQIFAERVRGLGASVVVFDPFLPPDFNLPIGVRPVGSSVGLATCDAVSLHAPGGRCIVDAEWLAHAAGLALVNTARADLVDETALAAALAGGFVTSYAADTLGVETGAATSSPLLAPELADRVTLTPHLGAQTMQAIDRMGVGAVRNVLAVLGGGAPVDPLPTTDRRVST